ncbi:MAG: hypothetical protein E6G91_01370 [Alphaproteobacteria bacterium]|nr:MAG: hypothetical protein E6G91_01370 [Alphaproteobacteria bacterium]
MQERHTISHSNEYQSARKILGDAAVRDIRIVEGVE